MSRKYLLYQDDCAPDSMEYFKERMKNEFGLDFAEFRAKGERSEKDGGMTIEWRYKDCILEVNYILEISADDACYKLAKDSEELGGDH